jgi:threonine/homoserine/homoserine lactone efflux protein
MNETLLYIGSTVIILWGIAHIIPTRAIVKGFGQISEDNRKVLTMELVAEGLTLIFLGVLPLLVNISVGVHDRTAGIVYLACAVMLLVMAVLTCVTGARTSKIWYRICPAVKTIVAVLFILSVLL